MGFFLAKDGVNAVLERWRDDYLIYAPVRMAGGGPYSDTDSIQYGQIHRVEEIVYDQKSRYSFKEILLPLSQTLFFFTEDQIKEAEELKKGAIIFLRSCDLHAVKRLDQVYLQNGFEDYYYQRLRKRVKFVLMGCQKAFENCFCVDMQTNIIDTYDASLEENGDGYVMDNHCAEWESLLSKYSLRQLDVRPSHVTETNVHVEIPPGVSIDVAKSKCGMNMMAGALIAADVILFAPHAPVLLCRIFSIPIMARLVNGVVWRLPAWLTVIRM